MTRVTNIEPGVGEMAGIEFLAFFTEMEQQLFIQGA
jgi:hypothetical protein